MEALWGLVVNSGFNQKQEVEMTTIQEEYREVTEGSKITPENIEINKMNIRGAIYHSHFQYEELEKLIVENNITDLDQLVDGETSIAWAARKGHMSVVKLLTEYGANVNSLDMNGMTPLMYVVKRDPSEAKARENLEEVVDFVKLAELLIDHGANINQQDAEGKTALMWAASEGHVDMVKLLLANGADLTLKDDFKMTALMLAVIYNHMDIVLLLIDHCDHQINQQDNSEKTVLGADIDQQDKAKKIAAMLNMDQQDNSGKTALMWAALKNRAEIVMLLVGYGANVDLKDNNGNTALMLAEKLKFGDIVKIIEDRIWENYIWNTIDIAGDDLKKLEQLAMTYNINDFNKPKDGEVPLVWAVGMNKPNVVKFLIEHKADVNQKGEDGRTALMMAALKGDMEILELLIKNGANVDLEDNTGETALMWAILGCHEEAARYLFDHGGANIDRQDNDGNSALMLAAGGKYIDGVRCLIERRANITLTNKEGSTVIAVACQSCHGHKKLRALLELLDKPLGEANFQNNHIGTDHILSPQPNRNNQMTIWDAVAHVGYNPMELARLIRDDNITNFDAKGGVSFTEWLSKQGCLDIPGYLNIIISILEWKEDGGLRTDEEKHAAEYLKNVRDRYNVSGAEVS